MTRLRFPRVKRVTKHNISTHSTKEMSVCKGPFAVNAKCTYHSIKKAVDVMSTSKSSYFSFQDGRLYDSIYRGESACCG